MNALFFAIALLAAAAGLSGCGIPDVGSPAAQIEMAQQQRAAEAKAVERVVDQVPDWYLKPPSDDLALLAPGTAMSVDLQFAVDKAVLVAKRMVADRVSGKLSSDLKDYLSETGALRNPVVVARSERVIKDVIVEIDLAGYDVMKQTVQAEGGLYRAFALVRYPIGDANRSLVDRIRRDSELDAKLQASKAFKDLEADVDAARRSRAVASEPLR